MTRKAMLAMMRRVLNDEQAVGFTEGGTLEEPEGETELLYYMDRAVDTLSRKWAAEGDVRLVKRLTAVNGAALPKDFLGFCGAVPIRVEGGTMSFWGEPSTLSVAYFARLPWVTQFGENEETGYGQDQAMAIVDMAKIYALNKHEFDVSQDLALLGLTGNGAAGQ